MPWLTLDDSHLNDAEREAGNRLADIVNHEAPMVSLTVLDEAVQPSTTVVVLQRPTERLLLVIRSDRSVLVATDDIYQPRWRDRVR
jgi:hypothetical protein